MTDDATTPPEDLGASTIAARTPADPGLQELLHYLQSVRQTMLWKLEGLSELDVRRPLTPTGTNLLGLVKHLAGVELGYFGECLGRPHGLDLDWYEEDAEDNADMWATPQESREDIVGLYHLAWKRTDAVTRELGPEATGHVPWWSGQEHPTVRLLLLHVVAETNRHAGHADILREQLDGAVGLRDGVSNMPFDEATRWRAHVERLEAAAHGAAEIHQSPSH
jgi:uncharacterized damage-inducible protein DinB